MIFFTFSHEFTYQPPQHNVPATPPHWAPQVLELQDGEPSLPLAKAPTFELKEMPIEKKGHYRLPGRDSLLQKCETHKGNCPRFPARGSFEIVPGIESGKRKEVKASSIRHLFPTKAVSSKSPPPSLTPVHTTWERGRASIRLDYCLECRTAHCMARNLARKTKEVTPHGLSQNSLGRKERSGKHQLGWKQELSKEEMGEFLY